jgi:SAM-dependent methyltransferase
VLEIGARREVEGAWWADIRGQLGDGLEWTGLDMQPGFGVDVVCNAEEMHWPDHSFSTVVCCEVLEHAKHPRTLLRECRRVLARDGCILVSVPFSFPVHNYPEDYWRFTPRGLELMLETAGFDEVETFTGGDHFLDFRDHDHRISRRVNHRHVFGVGVKR